MRPSLATIGTAGLPPLGVLPRRVTPAPAARLLGCGRSGRPTLASGRAARTRCCTVSSPCTWRPLLRAIEGDQGRAPLLSQSGAQVRVLVDGTATTAVAGPRIRATRGNWS